MAALSQEASNLLQAALACSAGPRSEIVNALNAIATVTPGTQVASKAVIPDANVNIGATKVTALSIGTSGSETAVNATAAELNRSSQVSTRAVTLSGSTSITTALHEGRDLIMTGTGSAFTQTLPAATGTGGRFRFWVGAVNTSNHVIQGASSSDIMKGVVNMGISNSATSKMFAANGSSNYICTLNGTTTGGSNIGGYIDFIDFATNVWLVSGSLMGSSTIATPFSG